MILNMLNFCINLYSLVKQIYIYNRLNNMVRILNKKTFTITIYECWNDLRNLSTSNNEMLTLKKLNHS